MVYSPSGSFNAPFSQITPLFLNFIPVLKCIGRWFPLPVLASPGWLVCSASFWLLLDGASRLVNPTFCQIPLLFCLYCFDIPTAVH
jgi:hypothetical protein